MNLYWIYDYPTSYLFVGLIFFFILFSVSGIFLLRNLTDRALGVSESDNSIISEYMGVTGVFFGLVLGMVAVGTWESYKFSSEVASNEASMIGVFYRTIELLPENDSKPLRTEVRSLMEAIIEKEWPTQQQGGTATAGEEHISRIGTLLYDLEVETPRQELAVGAATGAYFDMLKARRDRLQTVENSTLPGSLWWVVVASTGMIISLSMLMRIENVRLDIAINVLMSVLTGSILGFIIAMDNPYRGELSVSVDRYKAIYERQMLPK